MSFILQRRQDRIDWLIKNKDLWVGFPDSAWDLYTSKEFSQRGRKIMDMMREAGLYSKSTNNCDINLTASIRAARKQIREGAK